MRLKTLLHAHYAVPIRTVFMQFRLGASLFFCGAVGIYADYQLLQPSLLQEIFLLVSLLVIAAGFIIAMLAQVRMLISRILHFMHS